VLAAGYRIVALEHDLRDLAQEERRLRLEASYLASPQRIEQRAVAELHLAAPALEQVIFWEEIK
jgi:cell division protein FtsL